MVKKKSCVQKKIARTMGEWKSRSLRSGNKKTGRKVTSHKQAIAIALSTAQKSCKYNPSFLRKSVKRASQKKRRSRH